MLCALLAGGLTLGSTALHAQEAQTVLWYNDCAPVASVEALVDGDYVLDLYNNSGNNTSTGLINFDASRGENNRYAAIYNFDFDRGIITDESYIWTLHWVSDNTFTLQNKANPDVYFSTYARNLPSQARGDMRQNNDTYGPAHYVPEIVTEATVDGKTRFFLKLDNPAAESQSDIYLHTNNPGNYKSLSYWDGGRPGMSSSGVQMAFHPVKPVAPSDIVEVTYRYNVTNVGISFEQTVSAVVGDAYAALAVNFYTITAQPEGTVTGQETEPVVVNCTASYPGGLVAKGMTADGQFASDAKWYTLSVRGGQAVVATDAGIRTKGQTRQLAKGNMWTFVKEDGNPDGFKVYNLLKGAGSPLYLSSDANTTDASFATGSEESGTTTFIITANDNGFNLQYPGNGNANLGDHHEGPLSVWNHSASSGDDGSCFVVAEVNDLLELALNTDNYVGGLDATAAADLVPQYDNFVAGDNTTGALTALCEFDYTNAQKLELTDGYYRIKCAPVRGNRNLSLEAAKNRLSSATPSETDASQIWKIAATDGGLYTLTAQGVAPVKGDAGAQVAYTEAGSETATTFYVKKGNVNDSQGTEGLMWFFDTTTGDINNNEKTALNVDQSSNVILMPNNYGASVWYIQKAETIGLTIGGALCGTFCYDFAVELPEGLTAYRAVRDDADAIYLESIEGSVVPAGTPVLVQADEAKTHELTILSDAAALSETNAFEGTLLPEAIDAGVNAYILGKKETDEAPRFYLVSEGDRTMPANKAYYVATGTQTQGFRLSFDGTTTGIDSAVTAEGGETEVYYDLSGRRVLYPAKGIYVKANGQKVYLK